MQGHQTVRERFRPAARTTAGERSLGAMSYGESRQLAFVAATMAAPFIALWAMLSVLG